jgi:hypothetical protein
VYPLDTAQASRSSAMILFAMTAEKAAVGRVRKGEKWARTLGVPTERAEWWRTGKERDLQKEAVVKEAPKTA